MRSELDRFLDKNDVIVPRQVLEDACEYLIESEGTHYHECEPSERQEHIYLKALILRNHTSIYKSRMNRDMICSMCLLHNGEQLNNCEECGSEQFIMPLQAYTDGSKI